MKKFILKKIILLNLIFCLFIVADYEVGAKKIGVDNAQGIIDYTVVDQSSIFSRSVDCHGFFVEQNAVTTDTLPLSIKEFQDTYYADTHAWLLARKFTGSALEVCVLSCMHNGKLIYAIFVGLGEKTDDQFTIERYRRALGTLIRTALSYRVTSLAFSLPTSELFGVGSRYSAEQTAIIAAMTNYHFNDFITTIDNKSDGIYDIVIGVVLDQKDEVELGLKDGICIGTAVNKARYWVDLPPSDLTPPYLALKAREIAQERGLTITVFNEQEINNMGMGGLAGVSRGSDLDGQLVVIEYKTQKEGAPTIAFVGKGITFDSGGLSLKPARYMETMKEDMAGAAAVIAAVEALSLLQPSVNVIGVVALAENLPSGKALMPGDIIRFYNGKTAEIKDTDAEGRLVLADALSYVVKHYQPDAIIDLATLTGGCPVALGPFFSALMSQHTALKNAIFDAAVLSGDRVWELPLDNDFKPSVRSSVADLANLSRREYGAQTVCAAFFLQSFVDQVPWAHLDIAGTAFDVPDLPYYRSGATGSGVRLLISLALNWK